MNFFNDLKKSGIGLDISYLILNGLNENKLTIGILFGIYSSIMVGCPMAMWLGTNQSNLAISVPEKKKENTEL